MKLPSARTTRIYSLAAAIPVLIAGIAALTRPEVAPLLARGPLQAGHAGIDCQGCHLPSRGTLRQQVQGKLDFALGRRHSPVDFGYAAVDSDACLHCHARENERHPIYRFREPRFAEVRAEIDATSCLGCHSEHTGARAFMEMTACRHCHGDLALKNDPVDTPHAVLVAQSDWESCLGCHDFHGNHARKPQRLRAEAFAPAEIAAYLAGGANPYGTTKLFSSRTER